MPKRTLNKQPEPTLGDLSYKTPLHEAAASGQTAAVQLLIREGANINASLNYPGFETPLTLALNNGHVDAARLLLKAHQFINVNYVSQLLLLAIRLDTPDMARMLVQEFNADINIKDIEGKSLLHIVAEKGYSSSILPFLIQECKIDVNILDKWKKTAFYYAIRHQNTEMASKLINPFKANVNILDYVGQTPLHVAVNYGDIMRAQIILQESEQHLNTPDDYNQTPLYLAAFRGSLRMVNFLLDFEGVRSHSSAGASLAANNNAALLRAADLGDLPTLNRLLAFHEVVQNITANENAALRAAELHRHHAIIERLREFPAVVNFRPQHHAAPELHALANNRENAMRALDESQVGVVAAVKRHYQAKFDAMGGALAILADFQIYLEKQYVAKPARDAQNNLLPLDYVPTLASQVPYYKNIYHTAWRYLFARPNPWIDPHANFVDELPDGRAARISSIDKNHFAYLWLAASDLEITPTKEFTHESMKEAFTREIALIGRAHNYDQTRFVTKKKKNADGNTVEVIEVEEFDDELPDKPSCSMGVTQRLIQSVLGNPITEIPEARDLNATIFARRFNEQLLAENRDNPNGLYHHLNQLSVELLNQLKAILNVYLVNLGDKSCLSTEEKGLLDIFKIQDNEIDRFIEESKVWFGGNRITASNQNISWLAEKYDDYVSFAKELGINIPKHFSTKLGLMLDGLIREKSPSPILLFSDPISVVSDNESAVRHEENSGPKKRRASQCQ